jgi:hypothetical protein
MTLLHLRRHPRLPSSGATTLTSSSSLPSTRHTMRGSVSHLRSGPTPRRRHVRHPLCMHLQHCRVHVCRLSAAYQCRATRQWTSGKKSTTVMAGKIAVPPSSTTVRGGEISRVATSRKTLTHMHQHMGVQLHMHHALLTHRGFQEGAWRLPHTCVWLSDLTSFSPTYQKSMTGWSTPPNS